VIKLLIQGAVSRSTCEVIVIRLDIFSQVDGFAGFQFSDSVQDNFLTVVIGALVMAGQTDPADEFPTIRLIRGRDLIFWEDCLVRTFWDACSTIDTGVWIDIVPRPLLDGETGHYALHGANIHASRVAQTKAGNNVSHRNYLRVQYSAG
jgi:hypothetical protein